MWLTPAQNIRSRSGFSRDKVYEFALNGQTAKFVGEPPVSRGKLAAFAAVLGVLAAVITLVVGVMMK